MTHVFKALAVDLFVQMDRVFPRHQVGESRLGLAFPLLARRHSLPTRISADSQSLRS